MYKAAVLFEILENIRKGECRRHEYECLKCLVNEDKHYYHFEGVFRQDNLKDIYRKFRIHKKKFKGSITILSNTMDLVMED